MISWTLSLSAIDFSASLFIKFTMYIAAIITNAIGINNVYHTVVSANPVNMKRMKNSTNMRDGTSMA